MRSASRVPGGRAGEGADVLGWGPRQVRLELCRAWSERRSPAVGCRRDWGYALWGGGVRREPVLTVATQFQFPDVASLRS